MEQLLTANVATNLYWLGRHLERIDATLVEMGLKFDRIIDIDKDSGKVFYEKLNIKIPEYSSANEFLDVALFGDHPANVNTLITNARENAIICRAYLDADAFGTIIVLADRLKLANSNPAPVDFRFIEEVQELVAEVWGELTRKLKRGTSDYFIRLGKLVEKVDFHLRLQRNKEFSLVLMDEIDTIVSILAPDSTFKSYDENDSYETILNSINAKISKIVVE